ncbi:unnamed protein product [Arctia plantaginis]|uniref:Uncharacterized protein n=1 Tax=Arctia plantaginis TaxID=874455 RepID=A0A8S0ZPZ9_ARCPL|nr:unnamed protein product [Arctia plantaginis]
MRGVDECGVMVSVQRHRCASKLECAAPTLAESCVLDITAAEPAAVTSQHRESHPPPAPRHSPVDFNNYQYVSVALAAVAGTARPYTVSGEGTSRDLPEAVQHDRDMQVAPAGRTHLQQQNIALATTSGYMV